MDGFKEPASKRGRYNENATIVDNTADILSALEADDSDDIILDAHSVTKLFAAVGSAWKQNYEKRVEYKDMPAKFMESEEALDNAIQELHSLATEPHLFGVIVDVKGIDIFADLLRHPNKDISAVAINVLKELTEVDNLNEAEEQAKYLLDELIKYELINIAVKDCLGEFLEDKTNEGDALNDFFTMIENFLEFDPKFAEVCVSQGFFEWILLKVTSNLELDDNIFFMSQLLSQLLQTHETARIEFNSKINGTEKLLLTLAKYIKSTPTGMDETEHMENLFAALCASFDYTPNREAFLKNEGLQLLTMLLRKAKHTRQACLKVMSHATSSTDGKMVVEKLSEDGDLKLLFHFFVKSPFSKKTGQTAIDEYEEHITSILDALLRYGSENDRQKVYSLFGDDDTFVLRCLELHTKYCRKIEKFDKKNASKDYEFEEDKYLDRLEHGLFTLQRIVIILADICCFGNEKIIKAVRDNMNGRFGSDQITPLLQSVLNEYTLNLGPEADDERNRVSHLITKMTQIDTKNGIGK
uniref:DUF1716 domain-containing protein n=1 Tax=Rhabditophanes sp. KR3021 TaxID=114890 RepID=A0AC35TMY4_9BILA